MSEPAKSNKFSFIGRTLKAVAVRFYTHSIGQNAAALAYYFLFALFPMLIFISNLLGMLELNIYAIIYGFSQDNGSEFTGSLQYLCDFTGATKPTIIKALKTLLIF